MQRKIARPHSRRSESGERNKEESEPARIKGNKVWGRPPNSHLPSLPDYRGRLIRSIHFVDSSRRVSPSSRDDARVHVFTSETFVLRPGVKGPGGRDEGHAPSCSSPIDQSSLLNGGTPARPLRSESPKTSPSFSDSCLLRHSCSSAIRCSNPYG